jgi:hypothetical protein
VGAIYRPFAAAQKACIPIGTIVTLRVKKTAQTSARDALNYCIRSLLCASIIDVNGVGVMVLI